MAFISANINIHEVELPLPVQLYFPTDLPPAAGNEVKGVITLLHGLGNTPENWMQYSAACRYAADNGYILVAPSAANSFYTNMAYGAPWYTVLTEFLPRHLQRIFRIPATREKNFICGLSMGGYGAMRIGLSQPQRYAAVGSFSGALGLTDLIEMVGQTDLFHPLLAPLFGDDMQVPPEADLPHLARQVAALPAGQQPRLYVSCGRQDTSGVNIHAINTQFLRAVAGLPLDLTYEEWDGVHEWNFWDRSLARFIGFIQGSDYGRQKEADWAVPVATMPPAP